MRVNYVLLNINDRPLKTTADIRKIIAESDVKVGDRLVLEVFRDGKVLTIGMKTGTMPEAERRR